MGSDRPVVAPPNLVVACQEISGAGQLPVFLIALGILAWTGARQHVLLTV